MALDLSANWIRFCALFFEVVGLGVAALWPTFMVFSLVIGRGPTKLFAIESLVGLTVTLCLGFFRTHDWRIVIWEILAVIGFSSVYLATAAVGILWRRGMSWDMVAVLVVALVLGIISMIGGEQGVVSRGDSPMNDEL